MTRQIHLSRGNSPYVGQLAKGCRQCMKGAKLVLFITGKCSKDCYYCPISDERFKRNVVFANEAEVDTVEQAIAEAQMINATGMGITGGEPLLEFNRTLDFIRAFKERFGVHFHIHLYTGLEPLHLDTVRLLLDAGLDELRLHRFEIGEDYKDIHKLMKGRGQLGIEIPIIPGMLTQLKKMFKQLDKIGIDFINLNEMEFSSRNTHQLQRRGFKLESNTIASVHKSETEALKLLEWSAKQTSLNIHYCPLSVKDGTQLRNRFKRRAKQEAKSFERISNEGLLVKGIIVPSAEISLVDLQKLLVNEYRIQLEQIWVNESKGRIETSTQIARRLAKRLKNRGLSVGIVEEYPIATRFQVSYHPL